PGHRQEGPTPGQSQPPAALLGTPGAQGAARPQGVSGAVETHSGVRHPPFSCSPLASQACSAPAPDLGALKRKAGRAAPRPAVHAVLRSLLLYATQRQAGAGRAGGREAAARCPPRPQDGLQGPTRFQLLRARFTGTGREPLKRTREVGRQDQQQPGRGVVAATVHKLLEKTSGAAGQPGPGQEPPCGAQPGRGRPAGRSRVRDILRTLLAAEKPAAPGMPPGGPGASSRAPPRAAGRAGSVLSRLRDKFQQGCLRSEAGVLPLRPEGRKQRPTPRRALLRPVPRMLCTASRASACVCPPPARLLACVAEPPPGAVGPGAAGLGGVQPGHTASLVSQGRPVRVCKARRLRLRRLRRLFLRVPGDTHQKSVKRYIRKGVPLEHRARVWLGVSGAQAQMDRNPGYYQRLLQGESDGSLEEAIWTDMNRTFPDNERFRRGADPCLQRPLFNVLAAYGRHNRDVGYCQGMNFIAGYLLLVTADEEEAFWLLDALVGQILPDYYGPAMLGLRTDQEVLGQLVRTKLPAVAALLDGHGVLWALVVSRWFICLFVDTLPVETVLRVWDCLFSEGSKIIFRVALTLIKQHQASILEASSLPDICEKFRQITRGSFAMECHTFMRKIFSEPGSLPTSSIRRLRARCRAQLLAPQ
ncbi:Growth hormone-regulated TBC protein 1, partial [Galemys pyrenaicus]